MMFKLAVLFCTNIFLDTFYSLHTIQIYRIISNSFIDKMYGILGDDISLCLEKLTRYNKLICSIRLLTKISVLGGGNVNERYPFIHVFLLCAAFCQLR
jgi:hypothetical protein